MIPEWVKIAYNYGINKIDNNNINSIMFYILSKKNQLEFNIFINEQKRDQEWSIILNELYPELLTNTTPKIQNYRIAYIPEPNIDDCIHEGKLSYPSWHRPTYESLEGLTIEQRKEKILAYNFLKNHN